jgi:hypothetical protein
MFGPKSFRNAPVDKGDTLFVTHEAFRYLTLVESAVSAVRLSTFTPTAAFLGKPTKAQFVRLRRVARTLRKVYVLMDRDAVHASVDILLYMSNWVKTRLLIIPAPYKDPCDMPDEAIRRLYAKPSRLSQV